jgi:neutral ceramidase
MKAGFAELDVTPPVGVYLAGYPGRDEPSDGADDPLYVRVMALEDEAGARVVLVTGDLLKLPRDLTWRTKLWAERALGLPSAALIINLSHSHAAPGLFPQTCYPQWGLNVEYVCRFEQAVRDGIAAALADLQPAELRYGLHQADFGCSRRLPCDDGSGRVRMGVNPDGYYDPDLPIITCTTAGKLRGLLYSYACHATSKSSRKISADWPGQVAAGLKAGLGPDVIPLFAQGAAGSVANRVRDYGGEGKYEAYWREVADGIATFATSDQLQPLTLQLRATEKEFDLPYDLDRVPTTDELLALADPADGPVPDEFRPANRSILRLWARWVLEHQRVGTLPEAFRMHLTRWQLTRELQLLGLSGEVTAEVGRAIKDMFPPGQTIFLGYCSYTDAYIPRAAMLPEGGHEALCSVFFHDRPAPFRADIDETIERAVRELVAES